MRIALGALTLPLLLAAVLGGATVARADYKDSYREGIEAVDSGDWNAVARNMQAAIADNPSAGKKVNIYGMRFVPYLPYYHLGLARYKLGSCEAAVEALERSASEGAVRSDNDRLANLESMLSECRAELARRAPPTPNPDVVQAIDDAEAAIEAAETAVQRLERVIASGDAATVWRGSEDLRRRQASATEAIATAKGLLDAGRSESSLQQLTDAKERAEMAQGSLSTLVTEVRQLAAAEQQRRQDEERRRAEAARRKGVIDEIQRLRQEGRSTLDASQGLSGGALEGRVRALTAALDTASGDLDSVATDELESLRDRLAGAITEVSSEAARLQSLPTPTPRPSPTPTPRPVLPTPTTPSAQPSPSAGEPRSPADQLRDGAAAYLATRYESAIDLLRTIEPSTPRERLAQHVLLAAARFALSRQRAEATSSELVSSAAANVRQATEIDPDFQPNPLDFSPAFRQFFAVSRQ
jgi:hypothetical protein